MYANGQDDLIHALHDSYPNLLPPVYKESDHTFGLWPGTRLPARGFCPILPFCTLLVQQGNLTKLHEELTAMVESGNVADAQLAKFLLQVCWSKNGIGMGLVVDRDHIKLSDPSAALLAVTSVLQQLVRDDSVVQKCTADMKV
jgi:hypothetical protein